MTIHKLLKQAADELDAVAAALEASEKKVAEVQKAASQAKTAEVKVADNTAKLGGLAKVAADKMLSVGLISSAEKRDGVAAELLSHEAALAKLAKLAEMVSVPKLAQVVPGDTSTKTGSADEAWAAHAQKALAKLR